MVITRSPRRGIYLLPTLFTVGNLFCGFLCLVLATRGQFAEGALLIVAAGVLDGLDGRIARLTGTTSEFGLEFDSLADITSFGIAPAFLAYQWALTPMRRVGWLVAFLYVVCAATRLARFNIQHSGGDRRYFAGLPSPAAAGVVACLVFALANRDPAYWKTGVAASAVGLSAILMVSKVRYRSFKEFDLRNRRSYTYVIPIAGAIAVIWLHPKTSLLLFSTLYLVSGPVAWLWGLARRDKRETRLDGTSPDRTVEVADEPGTR